MSQHPPPPSSNIHSLPTTSVHSPPPPISVPKMPEANINRCQPPGGYGFYMHYPEEKQEEPEPEFQDVPYRAKNVIVSTIDPKVNYYESDRAHISSVAWYNGELYYNLFEAIRKIGEDGKAVEVFSKYQTGCGYLPCITFDDKGTLFYCANDKHKIKKVTFPSKEISDVAGSGKEGVEDGPVDEATFNSPYGLAYCKSLECLFVTDFYSHSVRMITKEGEVKTFAGKNGVMGDATGMKDEARFKTPMGLCIVESGDDFFLLVADKGNAKIRKVSSSGDVSDFPAADQLKQTLPKWDPTHVTTDSVGNVFVVDHANSKLYLIDLLSQITLLVGKFHDFRNRKDGNGEEASLYDPSGICVVNDNVVYLADTGYGRLRKIILDPNVQ